MYIEYAQIEMNLIQKFQNCDYKLMLNFKAIRQKDKMKQKHRTVVMQRQ